MPQYNKRKGPELTPEQEKAYRHCRERVKKILEKYRDQGLITYSRNTKHTFFYPLHTWPYREFEIRGRFCIDTEYNKYFGFRFSMRDGVGYKWGVISSLYQKRFEEFIPDKEKWENVVEKFLEEIEKETFFERFLWKKNDRG